MINDEIHLPETLIQETTNQFIAAKLGVDLDAEKALELRIQDFKLKKTAQMHGYLEESKQKRSLKDHCLYILNEWGSKSEQTLSSQILSGEPHQSLGGFFIRWKGMGIVLNPGTRFLENFHKQGLYISDIHFVIATQNSPLANADVKRIYDLNCQLNKISPELHVIRYYLNHHAYQELSHILKPNFKQERNTVHSLELFLDSPDIESEDLTEEIRLSYFSTSSGGGYFPQEEQGSGIGIRLEFGNEHRKGEKSFLKVGYVSGAPWNPLLAHHLGPCDVLITGFGSTNPSDYGKLNYNENSLGYFGTYTLFEEIKPRLLLCTEFDGREGDIRLEAIKKMRKEYQMANGHASNSTILPSDNGLFVDLKTQKIECSVTRTLLEPEEVRVVKDSDTHGKLLYLSPNCIL